MMPIVCAGGLNIDLFKNCWREMKLTDKARVLIVTRNDGSKGAPLLGLVKVLSQSQGHGDNPSRPN